MKKEILASLCIGLLILSFMVTQTEAASGSSDSFGYQWTSNTYPEPTISATWHDITATGYYLDIDGDSSVTIDIGFDFPFYGNLYSTLTISSNGYITFGNAGTVIANISIPNSSMPNNIIAPFWDNLTDDGSGYLYSQEVYYQVIGTAPERKLVILWDDAWIIDESEAGITLEVVLKEGTGDILFQYQCEPFSFDPFYKGSSATIGIENEYGSVGTQYSFNTATISDNVAILFSTTPVTSGQETTVSVPFVLAATDTISTTVSQDGIPLDARITGIDYSVDPKPAYYNYEWYFDISHLGYSGEFEESVCPDTSCNGLAFTGTIYNFNGEAPYGTWQYLLHYPWSTYFDSASLLIHYAYAVENEPPADIELGIDPADPACEGMVGNPVRIYNGNKFEAQQDINFPSPNRNRFTFSRYYNSQSKQSDILGYGWSHSYSASLTTDNNINGMSLIRIESETGKAHYFQEIGRGRWDGVFHEKSYVQVEGDSYVWHRRDGSKQQFSSNGKLAWTEDSVGNRQTLTYDGENRLEAISDVSSNRTITLHYSANRLESISGPVTDAVADGIWVTYGYDGVDNLVSITYSDGSGFNLKYNDANDPHNLTAKKDMLNHSLSAWAYDARDRAYSSSTRDDKGAILDYINYIDGTGTIDITDDYGVTRTYTINKYDGISKIASISGPGGCTSCIGNMPIRYEYDGDLNITEKEYANDVINKYENFDDRGNPGKVTLAFGTAEERVINYTYHPTLNTPLSQTEASVLHTGNREIIYDYDNDYDSTPNESPTFLLSQIIERGNTIDETLAIIPYEDITTYHYNAKGQIGSVDGPLSGDQDKTIYSHDPANGNLISITEPLIGTTSFSDYDSAGNPQIITDINNTPWLYMYDGRNRETFNKNYEITYTTAGEIETLTDNSGHTTTQTYEAAYGRLEKTTDPAGNYFKYGYNDQGSLVSVEAFDSADTRHYFMQYNYSSPDLPGKLWKTIKPDGSEAVYSYDPMGNVKTVQDETGTITRFAYDSFNRITQNTQVGETNAIIIYKYDSKNNITKVTDGEGLITSFIYSDRRNLLETNSPDTGITRYTYDEYGRLQSKTDQKGITVTYSHDSRNRLTGIDYPTDTDTIFEYDSEKKGKGQLTRMTDASGIYEYQYDSFGNLIEEKATIDGTTYTTSYSYDGAHRLTAIIYPSGRKVAYARGSDKNISRISTRKMGVELDLAGSISNLPFGPLNQLTYGNGLTRNQVFDQAYQISSISSGTVQDLSYSLYPDGLVHLMENILDPARDQDFDYNSRKELKDATGIYGLISFDYDLTGNRLFRATASDNATYQYEPLTNKLDTISGATPINFAHDPNGNIITKGDQTFTYNESNRLIKAESGTNVLGEYVYNGHGHRVKKTSNGITTLFFYDMEGKLIEERSSDGSLPINYIYRDDQLIARLEKTDRGSCGMDINWDGVINGGDITDLAVNFGKTNCGSELCPGDFDNDWDIDGLDIAAITPVMGTTSCPLPQEKLYYYHTDHLGTPNTLTDESGAIVWQADYLPFGKALVTLETVMNNVRMPGQYFDVETGLHSNWWRTFDPYTGRLMTCDPIGLAGGINPFIYVGNDPINYTDPSGLRTYGIDFSGTVGGGVIGTGGETFVIDSHGNYGVVDHSGAGGGAPSGSVAAQLQYTNAETIHDLVGSSVSVGGSVGPGVQGTGEMIFSQTYTGNSLGVAAGPGLPAEFHSVVEYATVRQKGNIWNDLRNLFDFLSSDPCK